MPVKTGDPAHPDARSVCKIAQVFHVQKYNIPARYIRTVEDVAGTGFTPNNARWICLKANII
jgi:hypothetical protein